jgi:hypothetical protein
LRIALIGCAVLTLALSASAEELTWSLQNVNLANTVTASGTFKFDADAGTPCSTGNSTCGVYSNIDITTTAGDGIPAETYKYACGSDVPSCNYLSPNSAQVLFLTSNASNQSGLEALALVFTGVGVDLPMPGESSMSAIPVASSAGYSRERATTPVAITFRRRSSPAFRGMLRSRRSLRPHCYSAQPWQLCFC